jgi:hypothetical protein
LLLGIALAGCSNYKARGKVKGRVKFFDKYLTCGTVAFTAKDGRVGSGNIDFDGNYEVSDAPIGDVTVTVKVPTMGRGPEAGMGPAQPPPGVPPMRAPGGGEGEKTFMPAIDPSKIVEIPGRYGRVEDSGLTYTVVKGEQTHNITLSP